MLFHGKNQTCLILWRTRPEGLVRWSGWKGSVRDYRLPGNRQSHVNPIRSKTKQKATGLPGLLSGRSLEITGNGNSRQMIIHDITRLIVLLSTLFYIF